MNPRNTTFWVIGLYLLSTTVIAWLIYTVQVPSSGTLLTKGGNSPLTFTSPNDLLIPNEIATQRAQEAARSQIPTIFSLDSKTQRLVLEAILISGLSVEVSQPLIEAYTKPDGVSIGQIPSLIRQAMIGSNTASIRESTRQTLNRILLPTYKANLKLTQTARDAAAASVTPILTSLRAGQVIVKEGEALTTENLRVLEQLGFYSPGNRLFRQNLISWLSSVVIAGLFSTAVFFAGRHLTTLSPGQLIFLVTLSLALLTLQKFAFTTVEGLLIIAVAPVLISVLVSETVGLFWAICLGTISSVLMPSLSLETLFSILIFVVASALLVRLLPNRLSLLIAPTIGGTLAAFGYLAVIALNDTTTVGSSFLPALSIFTGGILTGIFALGILPIAESAFGFLTSYRLLELSNPNSPLLRKLLLEAPGTYQHSLVISSLVEEAVEKLNGNQLLARVGALYHDVGKLRRPRFFIENQFSEDNPHDNLSPHLSYLIIINHVREGLDLLKRYRLPRIFNAFVAEHHGTTILRVFYKKALEETETTEELSFRYPGPRPGTLESAVLMLADSVEPGSRTLQNPTPSNIRSLIDRVFDLRLKDNQLSGSPLTLKDLEVVANSFQRTLTAILHKRIDYPTAEEIRSLRNDRNPRRDKKTSGQ